MKFLHISDLHLGKRVHGVSMLEDQAYILEEILQIAQREQTAGLLIAGDVYDRAVPPAEAVSLLDSFLTRAVELGQEIYMISGNHDSAQRLSFGSRLLENGGVHIAPVYNGRVESIVAGQGLPVAASGKAAGQEDAVSGGRRTVRIWLLPFIKPAEVRRFFEEAAQEEVKNGADSAEETASDGRGRASGARMETYDDAFRAVMERIQTDPGEWNILVAHQFVTGALRSESEDVSVGGMDNVDAAVLDKFDYVALGHIHRPQDISMTQYGGKTRVRYCGAPLKYAFSEAGQEKTVTLVEIPAGEAADAPELSTPGVRGTQIPLTPRRDMRRLRGTYEELTLRENYEHTSRYDYLHITLTDEEDIPGGMEKLRCIYPNLLQLEYDNRRTREQQSVEGAAVQEQRTPLQHFEDFYQLQNNQEMSAAQRSYLTDVMDRLWEGNV